MYEENKVSNNCCSEKTTAMKEKGLNEILDEMSEVSSITLSDVENLFRLLFQDGEVPCKEPATIPAPYSILEKLRVIDFRLKDILKRLETILQKF